MSDSGSPSFSSSVNVSVVVGDVNDHTPQFVKPSYSASIKEDVFGGYTVLILNRHFGLEVISYLSHRLLSFRLLTKTSDRMDSSATPSAMEMLENLEFLVCSTKSFLMLPIRLFFYVQHLPESYRR